MENMTFNGGVQFLSRDAHRFRGSPYHYIPTRWVAIVFISLFGFSTLLHAGQTIRYRMWWLFPTVCLCGILEVLGWSARLWSSFNPPDPQPFEMQITATILGPTPFLAANFVIFGIIIQRLGVNYSRLSPRWYTILFCTCDVISLIVQGVGGGKAAVAAGNLQDPTPGGNIMLGGIVFQLLTITLFTFCAIEFYARYYFDKPFKRLSTRDGGSQSPSPSSPGGSDSNIKNIDSQRKSPMSRNIKVMSLELLFSTTCLFIRAVYRTIELSDGWSGVIISTQRLFNVLDGAMVLLTIYSLNIAHPGLLLGAGSGLSHGIESGSTEKPLDTAV